MELDPHVCVMGIRMQSRVTLAACTVMYAYRLMDLNTGKGRLDSHFASLQN